MTNIDPLEGTFVRRVTSDQTGGGVMVDFVELNDGTCLTISDEVVILRPSADDFYEGDQDTDYAPARHIIDRTIDGSYLPTLPRERFHEDDCDDLLDAWRAVKRVQAPFLGARADEPEAEMLALMLDSLDRLRAMYLGGSGPVTRSEGGRIVTR